MPHTSPRSKTCSPDRPECCAARSFGPSPPAGGEIPEDYVFDELDDSGTVTQVKLSELFAPGKNALVIYNYMFPRHTGDLRQGPELVGAQRCRSPRAPVRRALR